MDYLMYFVWAYCYIGTAKAALVLMSLPASLRTLKTLREESGMPHKATFRTHLIAIVVTVSLPFFTWWLLLYREGWGFFAIYDEEDVVRDTIQGFRDTL